RELGGVGAVGSVGVGDVLAARRVAVSEDPVVGDDRAVAIGGVTGGEVDLERLTAHEGIGAGDCGRRHVGRDVDGRGGGRRGGAVVGHDQRHDVVTGIGEGVGRVGVGGGAVAAEVPRVAVDGPVTVG